MNVFGNFGQKYIFGAREIHFFKNGRAREELDYSHSPTSENLIKIGDSHKPFLKLRIEAIS